MKYRPESHSSPGNGANSGQRIALLTGWTAGGTFSVSDGTQNRVTAIVVAISDAGDVSKRYIAIMSSKIRTLFFAIEQIDRLNRSIFIYIYLYIIHMSVLRSNFKISIRIK